MINHLRDHIDECLRCVFQCKCNVIIITVIVLFTILLNFNDIKSAMLSSNPNLGISAELDVVTKSIEEDIGKLPESLRKSVVKYRTTQITEDGYTIIMPRLPFMTATNDGRKEYDSNKLRHMLNSDYFPYPALDIKLVNNSEKAIYFTKAKLIIEDVTPDLSPLVFGVGTTGGKFRISNIGWGDVVDSIAYLIVSPGEDSLEFESLHMSSSTGPLPSGKTIYLDIVDELARTIKINTSTDILREIVYQNYGPSMHVQGDVSFRDSLKNIHKADVNSTVWMGLFPGTAPIPSFNYNVDFKVDEGRATKIVSINQSIKRGESDRFLITINPDKSATYSCTLILLTLDDDKVNLKFKLTVFRPNIQLPTTKTIM